MYGVSLHFDFILPDIVFIAGIACSDEFVAGYLRQGVRFLDFAIVADFQPAAYSTRPCYRVVPPTFVLCPVPLGHFKYTPNSLFSFPSPGAYSYAHCRCPLGCKEPCSVEEFTG